MSEIEPQVPTMQTVWYKNTTFWTNVVVVAALIGTSYFGLVIPAQLQAGSLAIINIVLQSPTMAATKSRALAHNKAARARMLIASK